MAAAKVHVPACKMHVKHCLTQQKCKDNAAKSEGWHEIRQNVNKFMVLNGAGDGLLKGLQESTTMCRTVKVHGHHICLN